MTPFASASSSQEIRMSQFKPARRAFGARVIYTVTLVTAVLSAGMSSPRAEEGHPRRVARVAPLPPNAVVHWNSVAEAALTPAQGTNPMAHSRILAILHASIHDALNAIDHRYHAYTPGLVPAPQAHPDAAVAAAAREVLVRSLPEQAGMVETAYGRALADIRDGAAKTAGIALGQAAAAATLERRRDDGATGAAVPYVPGTAPGEYQFTPPFDFAAQPGWGRVKPFAIVLADYALDGPQPLTSDAYARDLAYVKKIGHLHSTTRSAEQTEIARFWYEDSTLGWNRIANTVVRQRGIDAWDAARAFALVHFAMADGFIAGFDEKYRHRFWRPETAIRAAGHDGNARTEPDAAWKPLLITPPVPDYPSTHTVLGWAAAEVLIELFGDRERYELTSLTLPGVTRSYRGFSKAAEENGLSRLYAGIHFRHAVRDGRRQGRSIGQAVAEALPRVD
jgi:hypothetical protein